MFKLENLRCSTFVDSTFAMPNTGYTKGVLACALPCRSNLGGWIKLTLPGYGSVVVQQMDVGPYLWWDDEFIKEGKRPMVEEYYKNKKPFPSAPMKGQPWDRIQFSGKRPVSRAAVDVTPDVWIALGMNSLDIDKDFKALKNISVNDMIMEWPVEPPAAKMPDWLRLYDDF